jgi:D-alanyl-lipoteichoic acid acyltransferase DltB (MBOAT superfamily)
VQIPFDEKLVTDGLRIALFGLFKKLVIANQLAPYITKAYTDLDYVNGQSLWIIFLFQPLYLYFDFSGYTDIAIGFSKTLGINLFPNFNRPLFAENVTTFWKRFHISLSSWFNDYVFKQLSFRFRSWGVYSSVFAVFITWSLFGIWHGAGWNFMLLGLLQAVAIIYEFFTKKTRTRIFSYLPEKIRRWSGRIIVYLFYCCSLVFFFSPDIKYTYSYFLKLAEIRGPLMLGSMSTKPFMVLFYILVFLTLELIQNDYPKRYAKLENYWNKEGTSNRFVRWTIYTLIITLVFVVGNKSGQFIYVNF